jgi:dinuclear metal center YbgI/SA1388 family protein
MTASDGPPPVGLGTLVEYLDRFLAVAEIPDGPGALNGLQVENSGVVRRVAAAVDACQATIDAAAQSPATLLLVHHGLFWGDPQPAVGRHRRRLKQLFDHDIAVYSAHLPLDCHPEVGNNAILAAKLGVREPVPFADYLGTTVGVAGSVAQSRDALVEKVTAVLGGEPHVIPAGPDQVKRIGIVTGGGGGMIAQARDAGIDTFLTGEGPHHSFFDAEEWGINVLYGGHYATETFGVKALAAHIEERFGLPWEFIDHPTGL